MLKLHHQADLVFSVVLVGKSSVVLVGFWHKHGFHGDAGSKH
jgi:hypothetical protein